MTAPSLLLVEDSETQALQFRRMAESEGFAVSRTPTAEEALERLNAGLPDLLVVDYRLPGMNGDELVRILRQASATRTLPILMLTGDEGRDAEARGLDSGASAYVPKAGGRELIVSRMRSLLRQRRGAAPAAGGAGLRQARLLLVGDAPAHLRTLLSGDGHSVALGTAADALDTLAREPFDGVLLAPDAAALAGPLDGWRQEHNRAIEIVVMARIGDAEAVISGLAAGADDVVPEGPDLDMLLLRLRATLRRKLARDQEAAAFEHTRTREVALARARAEASAADALAHANRELAAANQQLHDAQAQLVQSAKMASLGELVAGIAHEINNPLAFILAHHATVEKSVAAATGADDPAERDRRLAKAGDRLGAIRTGLQRIQELVVKLRRFSRLDDGGTAPMDVPEAIDAVVDLLGPRFGAGVEVVRDYGPQRMLDCSPALVNQVVMNIVANAADAVDPANGRICIATLSREGDFLIRISDNGPGISPEQRARVFEPFFTTKDVGAGTGLGLAIAYGIVRAHGGTIAIDDAREGGARFTITIPEARS